MSNSVVTLSSFNLLFLTQVLTVLTSTIKYNEYVTDKGENISIPCIADGNIMWVKENGSNNNTIIQTGKYLILRNVSASDRGIYVCFAAVTPRKSITSTTATSHSTHDGVSVHTEKESQDEKSSVMRNQTNIVVISVDDAEPSVENNINIKTKTNASTTSMLPMPNDATNSSTSLASLPTIVTASPPASASASNKTMPAATTSDNNSISLSNVTNITTITTNATSSSSSSNSSHNTSTISSNNNNTTTSSSNATSSSPSKDTLITTTTLLPLPSSHGGEHHPEQNTDEDDDDVVQEFQAFQKINLTVRTPPGPVSQLYFKASTILGFLVWRFNKTNSGGYPVRSFTAEFRNVSYDTPPYNSSFEHQWSRMDPINIAPNVRQMEVYRLEPNTTYEFRMWANNHLGSGEVVTTNVTTLPETKEEDLIRLIQPDLDNFDPRIWIVAVSIVLGTFVILAIGLCIVLTRECYQSSQAEFENGWDSIELIPNIILNPGFSETDDGQSPPITAVPLPTFSRTIVFGDESDSCESESDHEPRMEKFKRKLSVFFTDPTIKRI
ncbi:uncharacterized protein isoform X2 [Musca autumnalis]|uniref:uncharacterized protein isoform X2 n=1 Tax=Musca autumnalis TaxID=221902 RepID=UPI003CE6C915